MSKTVPFAVLCAALFAASPALASVSVRNKDTKPHTIVVNRGNSAKQMKIASGATVQVDCPQDCGFRDLEYGFSRLAGGNDHLVIGQRGMLHFKGGHGDEVFTR